MEKRTLKGIRADLGLSQEQMAEKIGCARVSYANKEAGRSPLLARELVIISILAKIPMEQIKIPK